MGRMDSHVAHDGRLAGLHARSHDPIRPLHQLGHGFLLLSLVTMFLEQLVGKSRFKVNILGSKLALFRKGPPLIPGELGAILTTSTTISGASGATTSSRTRTRAATASTTKATSSTSSPAASESTAPSTAASAKGFAETATRTTAASLVHPVFSNLTHNTVYKWVMVYSIMITGVGGSFRPAS